MIFVDGSTPPQEIVTQFMTTCEKHFADPKAGAIAIHCKAGLGRTGTLIGLYCMKHFQISAEPFIGWIRIARPGSVLGPQQYYLTQQECNYVLNSPLKLKSSAYSGYNQSNVEMSP